MRGKRAARDRLRFSLSFLQVFQWCGGLLVVLRFAQAVLYRLLSFSLSLFPPFRFFFFSGGAVDRGAGEWGAPV